MTEMTKLRAAILVAHSTPSPPSPVSGVGTSYDQSHLHQSPSSTVLETIYLGKYAPCSQLNTSCRLKGSPF